MLHIDIDFPTSLNDGLNMCECDHVPDDVDDQGDERGVGWSEGVVQKVVVRTQRTQAAQSEYHRGQDKFQRRDVQVCKHSIDFSICL